MAMETSAPSYGGAQSYGAQSYAPQEPEIDEEEARMRAEMERQRRIKEKLENSRGRLPPNFNLLASAPYRREGAPEPAAAPAAMPATPPASMATGATGSLDWKSSIKVKKQQEEEMRMQQEQVRSVDPHVIVFFVPFAVTL
jgi:hypothetical protein